MKIGFNLLLWTDHVQRQHWPVLDELKHCGYDGVEAPVFEGRPDTYAELGDELDRRGLERTAISVSQAQRRIQLGRKPRSSFATVGKLPESGGPARVSCAKSPPRGVVLRHHAGSRPPAAGLWRQPS